MALVADSRPNRATACRNKTRVVPPPVAQFQRDVNGCGVVTHLFLAVRLAQETQQVEPARRERRVLIDSYPRTALGWCGCWSHVIASHTLMSIKYDIIRCLCFRTERSRPALALHQRQLDPLTPAPPAYGHHLRQSLAVFGHHDPFPWQIPEQCKAPAPEFGDAEKLHD